MKQDALGCTWRHRDTEASLGHTGGTGDTGALGVHWRHKEKEGSVQTLGQTGVTGDTGAYNGYWRYWGTQGAVKTQAPEAGMKEFKLTAARGQLKGL